ncbi:MAG: hypothetical protein U0R68_06870 [Candidatus Nanopelagicales bacterium]
MLEGLDDTWTLVAVIVIVAGLIVLRVRAGRVTDFDRTPAERWTVRIVDALAIAVVLAILLAIAGFVVIALLAVPWPEVGERIGGRGAWPVVILAVVVFGLVLWLTPQWFRPAHLRAMRDDEALADDAGGRKPARSLFDATGRTYPDGTALDPQDR